MQDSIRVIFCFKQFGIAFCGVLMLCLLGTVAQAATQIVDPTTGKLRGATGVTVGGALLDVSFVDGSCISLFSGCNSTTNFQFQSQSLALLASQALFDQVLLDTPAGAFDSFAALTAGLDQSGGVPGILTPFGFFQGGVDLVETSNGLFNDRSNLHEYFCCGPSTLSFDTSLSGGAVWAVWTASSVTVVPEPEIYAMMAVGLGLLGWAGRRKKLKDSAAV